MIDEIFAEVHTTVQGCDATKAVALFTAGFKQKSI